LKRALANPLHQDCDGWTALHNACSRGKRNIVELLVNQPNVNVNVTSNQGHTPLSKEVNSQVFLVVSNCIIIVNAASKGFVDIVLRLLERYGANPMLKNKFGESAYDVAAAAGEAYLCQLLEQYEIRHCQPILYNSLDYHVTIPVLLVEEEPIDQQQTSSSLPSSSSYLGSFLLKNSSSHNIQQIQQHTWYLDGKSIQNKTKVELPNPSWFWLSDWTIDHTFPDVDEAGWSYYQNGQDRHHWLPSSNQWIKRRRWIRTMKKVMEVIDEDASSSNSNSNNSGSSSSSDNDSHSLGNLLDSFQLL
jgi:hypothetical protein